MAASSAAGNDGPEEKTKEDFHHLFTFTSSHKAGMDKVDREKANQIIYEMSKDSSYFKNEQRKAAEVDKQITEMLAKADAYRNSPPEMRLKAEQSVRGVLQRLEKERESKRGSWWCHVDMDMFYCAVEIRDNPSLKDKPVAVGAGPRCTLCTANYIARSYGVRNAMPGFIAQKLCSDKGATLVFVPPRMNKYAEESKVVREVLSEFDPHLKMGSLDEAVLNLTDYLKKNGLDSHEGRVQIATQIRQRIAERTGGLTASAGIAPGRMIAKIASDMNKPNGQTIVEERDAVGFTDNLSVRKIPGVGKVGERKLEALNIKTCRDILDNAVLITQLFTDPFRHLLLRAAMGVDGELKEQERKSFCCEHTFDATDDRTKLEKVLRNIAAALAKDLKSDRMKSRHVTIKVKTADFKERSVAMQLSRNTDETDDIAAGARKALNKYIDTHGLPRIPQLGIKCAGLSRVIGAHGEAAPKGTIDYLLQQHKHKRGKGNDKEGTVAEIEDEQMQPEDEQMDIEIAHCERHADPLPDVIDLDEYEEHPHSNPLPPSSSFSSRPAAPLPQKRSRPSTAAQPKPSVKKGKRNSVQPVSGPMDALLKRMADKKAGGGDGGGGSSAAGKGDWIELD
ncbi:unnamed protein product [Vitrella brassicaformis CCMP3155]|uniref:DNA polymerase kappa n=1 Tax=Vitrella brassicaformis (strain CCMP3155) TaxID=1169540 RepID=A0A0G4ES23_VITBC|nr:unnamed protein product [Vitrella brassicaformis CCMP3155]|eukprot:CEM01026.1 unnamed protein product [Vitrella brassicaformis CCMP3155]